MIQLSVQGPAVLLPVKATPGASKTRILGEWEGRLRVAVAAAPERGKANAELVAFLAKRLGLRKADVSVTAGATSPLKTIRIEGVTPDAVRAALGDGQPPAPHSDRRSSQRKR